MKASICEKMFLMFVFLKFNEMSLKDKVDPGKRRHIPFAVQYEDVGNFYFIFYRNTSTTHILSL